MRAGQLRDLVDLVAPQAKPDPRFGPQPGWKKYASVWAGVVSQTGTKVGSEENTAMGAQSALNFIVTLRYRDDVKPQHRIIYRCQPLEIVSVVDPDGCRERLEIQATLYQGVA